MNKFGKYLYNKLVKETISGPRSQLHFKRYQRILSHKKTALAAAKMLGIEGWNLDQIERICTGGYPHRMTYAKPAFKAWKGLLKGEKDAVRNQRDFADAVLNGGQTKRDIAIERERIRASKLLIPLTMRISFRFGGGGDRYADVCVSFENPERLVFLKSWYIWVGKYGCKHIDPAYICTSQRWYPANINIIIGKGTITVTDVAKEEEKKRNSRGY